MSSAKIAPATPPGSGWMAISPRVVVAFACLFYLVLQTPFFQSRWIEDENSYADAAWTFVHDGRIHMSMYPPTDLGSQVDARMPAMAVAQGGVYRVLGIGIWQARLLPLLLAVGAILLIYRLGAYLMSEWVGALAALLLATDTLLYLSSRTARPEAFIAFLNTLAALLFLTAIRRNSWVIAIGAGLVCGLAMNFHINGAIAAIAMGLWALYEYGPNIWRKPVPWAFALTAALCLVPYILWITSDEIHRLSYLSYQSTGTEVPMGKLHGELLRYADFLGVNNLKFSMPIPVRAPIAILIIGGLVMLWKRSRRVFWYLFLFLMANMGWWFYMANKNVRYTAVATPLFALIVAAGLTLFASTPRRRSLAIACGLIYGLVGIGGNLFIMKRYRDADYKVVEAGLRSAIPPGVTVYGASTFWLALHDRRYYSYDRALFDYTMANLKPDYIILYDRVMMHGSGSGADDFSEAREKGTALVKSRGQKVAGIHSSFYGDLEVYRLLDPAAASPQKP